MKALILVFSIVISATQANAHGARTDGQGCHRQTSDSTYHCHAGPNKGRKFQSKAEAQDIFAREQAPLAAQLSSGSENSQSIVPKQKLSDGDYSSKCCAENKGNHQSVQTDGTRADCELANAIVEIEVMDSAGKVYEAIGQALHYSTVSKKQGKLVMIPVGDMGTTYVERVSRLSPTHKTNIELVVYGITPSSMPKMTDVDSENVRAAPTILNGETVPELPLQNAQAL